MTCPYWLKSLRCSRPAIVPYVLSTAMNPLFRPFLRSAAIRHFPRLPYRCPSPSLRRPAVHGATSIALLQIRSVASSVSFRPGSQTLEHAATNVKEELGNSASDLAKVIAGANVAADGIVDSSADSFVSWAFVRSIKSSAGVICVLDW